MTPIKDCEQDCTHSRLDIGILIRYISLKRSESMNIFKRIKVHFQKKRPRTKLGDYLCHYCGQMTAWIKRLQPSEVEDEQMFRVECRNCGRHGKAATDGLKAYIEWRKTSPDSYSILEMLILGPNKEDDKNT